MIARLALLALLALLAPLSALAQGPPLKLPEGSPAATVSQRVGLTDLTVRYHRPAVKGRTVWGDLVPYRSGVARRRKREHGAVAVDAGDHRRQARPGG